MRRRQYDWAGWLDRVDGGGIVVLLHGEHYVCSQIAIAQQARNEAAARGVPIKLVDGGLSLTISRRFPRAAAPVSIATSAPAGA